jgi:hypothetical protein
VPDDDSFWRVAQSQGFIVRRGYMGSGNRSKARRCFPHHGRHGNAL